MQITNWVKIILDSLYDGVLIVDKDGMVQYVNPAYTRITKVKYEDIVDRHLEEVRPGARLTWVIKNGSS